MYETLIYTCIAVACLAVLSLLYHILTRSKSKKQWPQDTVVLYQMRRGPLAPSLSPFPIKLETYLRMAKISYTNNYKTKMSSKGKIPWISYNGEDLADSQLSIEFLNKKLDRNLDSHLSSEQRAVSNAFQIMVDEHLYWIVILSRWVFDKRDFLYQAYGLFQRWYIPTFLFLSLGARTVKKQTHAQGLGRHTVDECVTIGYKDLRTLSDQIGSKKFLMGDLPCQADCAVFGQLVQIVYQMPDSRLNNRVKEEYTNLLAYCTRMKEEFWPDWDDCVTHRFTTE